jgi:hypothetical protein
MPLPRVNAKQEIYLTDFLKSTFAVENAKKRVPCDGQIFASAAVYRAGINHAAAVASALVAPPRPVTNQATQKLC